MSKNTSVKQWYDVRRLQKRTGKGAKESIIRVNESIRSEGCRPVTVSIDLVLVLRGWESLVTLESSNCVNHKSWFFLRAIANFDKNWSMTSQCIHLCYTFALEWCIWNQVSAAEFTNCVIIVTEMIVNSIHQKGPPKHRFSSLYQLLFNLKKCHTVDIGTNAFGLGCKYFSRSMRIRFFCCWEKPKKQ